MSRDTVGTWREVDELLEELMRERFRRRQNGEPTIWKTTTKPSRWTEQPAANTEKGLDEENQYNQKSMP